MKLLLTSSGIRNTSIHDTLVDLLGKPIAESSALCIPTRVQPFPGGHSHVYGFITGSRGAHVRFGLEVVGRPGAHRAAQHQRRGAGRSRTHRAR